MAGSAALLVGIAAYATKTRSSPSKSSSTSRDLIEDIDENEEDFITAEEVTKIFDRLFLEMQQVMAILSQQIQQVQMSGQHIPETEIRKIVKTEFERGLAMKQTKVFEEYNVDAECLEEATWEFMEQEDEHPKLVRAVERFQKLYEQVSGEQVVGKRPGKSVESKPVETLSKEELLEIAEAYFSALTNEMKAVVDELKAQGKDVSNMAVAQEAQQMFASRATDAGDAALEALGTDSSSFQASIEKHAADPQVGRTLQMLQMKQQQEIMAMGFPM
jgi:hypothetical protein